MFLGDINIPIPSTPFLPARIRDPWIYPLPGILDGYTRVYCLVSSSGDHESYIYIWKLRMTNVTHNNPMGIYLAVSLQGYNCTYRYTSTRLRM